MVADDEVDGLRAEDRQTFFAGVREEVRSASRCRLQTDAKLAPSNATSTMNHQGRIVKSSGKAEKTASRLGQNT